MLSCVPSHVSRGSSPTFGAGSRRSPPRSRATGATSRYSTGRRPRVSRRTPVSLAERRRRSARGPGAGEPGGEVRGGREERRELGAPPVGVERAEGRGVGDEAHLTSMRRGAMSDRRGDPGGMYTRAGGATGKRFEGAARG